MSSSKFISEAERGAIAERLSAFIDSNGWDAEFSKRSTAEEHDSAEIVAVRQQTEAFFESLGHEPE